MIIQKKGSGQTIPYGFGQIAREQDIALLALDEDGALMAGEETEVSAPAETMLFLGENENMVIVDLAKRQQDSAVCIDVYVDGNGNFTEEKSDYYAANIIIPPKQYRYIDSGEVDQNERPIMQKEALPLDREAVTLVLWPLPEFAKEEEREKATV